MNDWRNKYVNKQTGKPDNNNVFSNTLFKNKLILILIFKYNPNELFRLSGTLKTGIFSNGKELSLYPIGIYKDYFLEHEIKGGEINWFNLEEILLDISNNKKYQIIIEAINNKSRGSSILSENGININEKDYKELKDGLIFLKASLSIYLNCVQEIYLKAPDNQINK